GKIFAMQHGMNGRPSVWCKAGRGFQQMIVDSDPARCFVPPYVGRHGWVGVYLDDEPDWAFLGQLVRDSYRLTAPKRLIAQLEQD
ncbi:MAG TPA: MmcQ/YjbR family DNA-binding protein, partial [Roseiflexaceae bacterium]|nr:MmcQ/YjbR family DNA-binding protein [Roseiflexaceae bacterium]